MKRKQPQHDTRDETMNDQLTTRMYDAFENVAELDHIATEARKQHTAGNITRDELHGLLDLQFEFNSTVWR